MHPRTPTGLTDRLGVVTVVFAAFDERLDILRGDQTNVMAQRAEFPPPMVRTAACFHDDFSGGKLFEEGHHLRTTEIGLQYSSASIVDAVKGEDGLGRVDANAGKVGHGRLRSWFLTTQFWHPMPWGRPPQQSKIGISLIPASRRMRRSP